MFEHLFILNTWHIKVLKRQNVLYKYRALIIMTSSKKTHEGDWCQLIEEKSWSRHNEKYEKMKGLHFETQNFNFKMFVSTIRKSLISKHSSCVNLSTNNAFLKKHKTYQEKQCHCQQRWFHMILKINHSAVLYYIQLFFFEKKHPICVSEFKTNLDFTFQPI